MCICIPARRGNGAGAAGSVSLPTWVPGVELLTPVNAVSTLLSITESSLERL